MIFSSLSRVGFLYRAFIFEGITSAESIFVLIIYQNSGEGDGEIEFSKQIVPLCALEIKLKISPEKGKKSRYLSGRGLFMYKYSRVAMLMRLRCTSTSGISLYSVFTFRRRRQSRDKSGTLCHRDLV
jgi:hypothetical protein